LITDVFEADDKFTVPIEDEREFVEVMKSSTTGTKCTDCEGSFKKDDIRITFEKRYYHPLCFAASIKKSNLDIAFDK
jgi:hypothetical protein